MAFCLWTQHSSSCRNSHVETVSNCEQRVSLPLASAHDDLSAGDNKAHLKSCNNTTVSSDRRKERRDTIPDGEAQTYKGLALGHN